MLSVVKGIVYYVTITSDYVLVTFFTCQPSEGSYYIATVDTTVELSSMPTVRVCNKRGVITKVSRVAANDSFFLG